MRYFQVFFEPAGRRVQAREGENLLRLAQRHGIHIDSSCGGNGSCYQCRVRIVEPSPDAAVACAVEHFQLAEGGPVQIHEHGSEGAAYLSCRGVVMGDLYVRVAPRVPPQAKQGRAPLLGRALETEPGLVASGNCGIALRIGRRYAAGYLVDYAAGAITAQTCHAREDRDALTCAEAVLDDLAARSPKKPVTALRVAADVSEDAAAIGKGWRREDVEISSFSHRGNAGASALGIITAEGLGAADKSRLVIQLGARTWIIYQSKTSSGLAAGTGGPWFDSTESGDVLEFGLLQGGIPPLPGAVNDVTLTPATNRFVIETVEGAPPRGLCLSGALACARELIVAGIARDDGTFTPSRTMRRRDDASLEVVLVGPGQPANSQRGIVYESETPIVFGEKDFQALRAAGSVLWRFALDHVARARADAGQNPLSASLAEAFEEVLFCGPYGFDADPETLHALGFVGDLSLDKVRVAGDAAGLGAAMVCAKPSLGGL